MTEPFRMGELVYIDDPKPADWISKRVRRHYVQDARADSVIPAGFAAYARIFHPAYRKILPRTSHGICPSSSLRSIPLVDVRWSVVATANHRIMHPEAQFESLIGYVYLNHREQPGVWDIPPRMGTLPKQLVDNLTTILSHHTETPERCWFAVWAGWGYSADQPPVDPLVHLPGRDYFLFSGPLSAATRSVLRSPGSLFQTASLWWPEDQSWCVATEIDYMSTYVGGTNACIAEILTAPSIEALPVKITDGVSRYSDHLNPPPMQD